MYNYLKYQIYSLAVLQRKFKSISIFVLISKTDIKVKNNYMNILQIKIK